ncbi:hypothetical protein GC089_01895 [Cellulomonas sp. JZ18]|uniref:Fic family protein n=1 Tax=Cellulomonas sp. JZ18 TaxID=2654191 RepID=UPI0012D4276A|nr:Fic family protein [Cellulomonas sp. JZ18]QGQ18245.1 hypothetical protein GC089_01895 [Cellulomonas sp. JZ18]
MRDHLLDWWRVRDEVPWSTAAEDVTGPVGGRRDGFLDHVRASAARDPARAARLEDALHRAGQAAATGRDLTVGLLAEWQAVVLGVPEVGFRTGPAYAKRGRERYGLAPTTEQRFARCLAEATASGVPLPSRTARVYLDVAFVHPFPDGNARAALLCASFVLRRDGVVLDLAAPLLTATRRADDARGARELVRLVEVLVAATRRRDQHRQAAPATPRGGPMPPTAAPLLAEFGSPVASSGGTGRELGAELPSSRGTGAAAGAGGEGVSRWGRGPSRRRSA